MKNKFVLVLAGLLLFGLYGNAAVVNVSSAQKVALYFYMLNVEHTGPDISIGTNLNFTQSEEDATVDFYVFDITPGPGFVIVSASDNVMPVLGYSTESNFNSNLPEIGLKGWMPHVAREIHNAVLQNIPASASVTALWSNYLLGINAGELKSTTVNPMCSTQWNQDPYYNLFCPYDSVDNGVSVTGCCATAMAQIMKFWNYPAHGTGSFTYGDSVCYGFYHNIGTVSADFGATAYQWLNMPDKVSGNTDDTAVARLMYDCGVAAEMDYGANGSSAYFAFHGRTNVLNGFTEYFGYDIDSIKYKQMAFYGALKWLPMIEKELDAGRPILYAGQDSLINAGHAWVCDGYDANNMLHMNWGWGGLDNGSFLISALEAGPYDLTWSQTAITGIEPPKAVTAIKQTNNDPGFKLYPNPAHSNITVEGNTAGSTVQYAVYDVLGNQILTGRFAENADVIELGTRAAGVYFVRLNNGGKEETHRIIIE